MLEIPNRVSRSMLTFITTYGCKAKCEHCMMDCAPNRLESLSLDTILRMIDWFSTDGDGKIVIFTGGECTQLGEDLFEAISYAYSRGLSTRIVTNAQWASSESRARQMVEQLSLSGLKELNISCDIFHSRWIDLDNIKNALHATFNSPIQTVVLAVCEPHKYKSDTVRMLDTLGMSICGKDVYPESGRNLTPLCFLSSEPIKPLYYISTTDLYRLGRARHLNPSLFYTPRSHDLLKCPNNRSTIVVSPGNIVSSCCGICHRPKGLFSQLSVDEFLDRPSEDAFLFQNIIEEVGPLSLYFELLTRHMLEPVEIDDFTSPCEICELISNLEIDDDFVFSNQSNLSDWTAGVTALRKAIVELSTESERE